MVLFLVLLCLLAVSKPASDDLPPPTELECSDVYDTEDPMCVSSKQRRRSSEFLNRYLILIIIIVLFVNLKLKQHYYGVNLKPHIFAKE